MKNNTPEMKISIVLAGFSASDIPVISESALAEIIAEERKAKPHLSELGAASLAYSFGIDAAIAVHQQIADAAVKDAVQAAKAHQEEMTAKFHAQRIKQRWINAGAAVLYIIAFSILWSVAECKM